MKNKKRLANFRLTEQDHEYLYDISEFLGISKTDVLRTLLRRFVRRNMQLEV